MPIEDCITVTGLALDIVGIALLFWVAPEKDPDPQSRAGFAIPREQREAWRKSQICRGTYARASLVLIILGFTLQACAVIFF